MSGDGRFVYWYQSEINIRRLMIYCYDRTQNIIDRMVYASDAIGGWEIFPWCEQKASVNEDGSVFAFSVNSQELAPTDRGTYKIPFGHGEGDIPFRTILLELTGRSEMNNWNLLR